MLERKEDVAGPAVNRQYGRTGKTGQSDHWTIPHIADVLATKAATARGLSGRGKVGSVDAEKGEAGLFRTITGPAIAVLAGVVCTVLRFSGTFDDPNGPVDAEVLPSH